MKSNWSRRWWARIHATLVWRRFRERALLRARRRSVRDRLRRSGLARLDGLARLEPRTLLAADIATDRFDYAPGSTAFITTFSDGGPDNNFLVGETIRFQVVRTDGLADNGPGSLPWKVTDGVGGFEAYVDETGMRIAPDRDGVADGRIETEWFVGSEYANASLEVRAAGLTSGETATEAFRDSAIVISSNMNWSQITTGSGVNGAPTANDSIVVNQGVTLTIDTNGAVVGGVTLGNGTTGTAALAFTTGTIGATFGSLSNNGTATVTLNNSGSTLTVGTANTNTTFAGTISGAGSLTKVGTGVLTLSGANTYTGGTNVTAGVLAYGANNVLPDTGSVTVNGGTLALGGRTDAVGAVSLLGGGSITGGASITGGVVANPDFDAVAVTGFAQPTGASWSFTNRAYISVNGSAFGFTHTPSGTQFGILQSYRNTGSSLSQTISVATAGYVSYAFRGQGRPNYGSAGVELVIDGTVQSTWPASAFTTGAWGDYVSQPVFLEAGTHTLQFRSITHAGDVATAIDAIKLSLPGLTGSSYDLQDGSVSANLAGSGALAKSGSGTVTLSGMNTYTGGTAINGGVLALGSAGALGTAGTISFGGGTLQYSASNTTDYSSRFATAANQAYSVDTNGENVTFATALTSSGGSLKKSGAGTLTLSGANTYAGGTTVSGGTLKLGANDILGDSGAVKLDGGTLELGAFSDTIASLAGPGTVTTTTGVLTVTGGVAGSLATGSIALTSQGSFQPAVNLRTSGAVEVTGLTVTGKVNLDGSALDLSIIGSAGVGQSVTIVDNDGTDPVLGAFAGLPEGTVFLAGNGQTFRISYSGGDGNDVVLTRVLVPLEVSGITVDPRSYDGTTNVVLNVSQAHLVGLLPADASTILVTQGVTGAYADPNAGTNKPVIVSGLALQGPFASNYDLLVRGVQGTVTKATATIAVTPYVVVETGQPHVATGTATGVNGEDLSTGLHFQATSHTAPGTYSDRWYFISPNSNYTDVDPGTWFDDDFPAGANLQSDPFGGPNWFTSDVPGEVYSGRRSLERTANGLGQDFYSTGAAPIPVPADGVVILHVWLDPLLMPSAIMLQLNTNQRGGESRAVWGDINAIGWGEPGTASRFGMGPLPQAGVWTELKVQASDLGLQPGQLVNGFALTQNGGHVRWDRITTNEAGVAITNTILPAAIDAPVVSLKNDTGTSATDRVTSDGALAVTGVASGNRIEYSVDGGASWSGSFAAIEGTNSVLVRQADVLGRVSTAAKLAFTLDTQAPAALGVSLANDTGSSATDRITSDGTLSISGSEAQATVQYSVDGGQKWMASFAPVEGFNSLLIRQEDPAGNVSLPTSFEFTLKNPLVLVPVAAGVSATGAAGTIVGAGQIDSWLVDVAAGQVVSAVVTGGTGQSVRIEFVGPDGVTVIASADSPAPGQRALVQSVRVSTAGQYAIRVIGIQGSGSYDLGVVVNAAIEEERADTATNLIVNGSFELGNYAIANNGGYKRVSPNPGGDQSNDSITGWIVGGYGIDWHLIVGPQAHFGLNSTDGGMYAADLSLDGGPWRGSIGQTFVTVPGASYEVSFLHGSPWFESALRATVAGVSHEYAGVPGPQFGFEWARHTFRFFATAETSTLVFESLGGGFWAPVIDVVSVTPVVNGNDTPESAQSIDGTAVVVDGAGDRLAVVGGSDPGVDHYAFTASPGQSIAIRALPFDPALPVGLSIELLGPDGSVIASGTNDGTSDGQTIDVPSAVASGTYVVRVVGTNPGRRYTLVVDRGLPDTTPPLSPVVSLVNDTGSSPTDRITADGTLSVTALESGARVEYSTDGQLWSTFHEAVEGPNSVLVRQIDLAGNASEPTTFDFVYDAQSPVAPLVTLLKDTGSSAVDLVTSDGTLTTSTPITTLFNTGVDSVGNVAPNWATDLHYTLVTVPGGTDVVRVATDANGYPMGPWIGGTSVSAWIGPASDSVLSGPGGSYVYRTTFDLTGFDPGTVSISGVWAMDDIGEAILINGQSRGYATWGWAGYNAFAPFAVTGGFVAGINTLDFVVSNGGGPTGLRVEMTGASSTVEAGAAVEYSIDDGVTWSGQFIATEGINRVLLRQIDLAGNISQPMLYEFKLDSTAPNAPVVSLFNDNGSSASDRITSDGTLSVTGLESGARVEYSTDGISWTAAFKVAEGPNSVGVRQIDQAGNVSPATTFDFTFDSSIPRNHLFKDQFGTGTPDGIRAWDTIDFSGCTVPLTFTVLPDGSLSVVDSNDPAKNTLVFSTYGNVVGGQNTNRFVFVGDGAFAGRVTGGTGGANTLDYASSSLAVNVDLGSMTATGTAGIERITAIVGSAINGTAGGNRLVGPAGGKVWTVTAAGEGTVAAVAFSGIGNLVAGSIHDSLDYSAYGGAVTVDLSLGTATGFGAITGFRNVIGSAFADSIRGDAHDNTIVGLTGDDTLSGGLGDDTLDGGTGSDAVTESADVDFTLSAAALAGVGSDALAGVESVSLAGGAGANTFTVDGWAGEVSLAGAAGNDRYAFSGTPSGGVTIVEAADADSDTLDFSGLANGGVKVSLAVTKAQAMASGLTLTLSNATGIENVVGTALTDTLVGNTRDNVFTGLAGDDTLTGGSGNDALDGGAGSDTVTESADVDFTLSTAALAGVGSDTLAGIESVSLTGGQSANTFTVNGWAGLATLAGAAGNDRYVFTGNGSVRIDEAADADSDTLDFSAIAGAAVSVDLAATTAQTPVAGLALTLSSATGIENVVGTALADTLVGNTRDNVLTGLAGNDVFTGLAGNDTFDGGVGSDTVRESADVDFTLSAAALSGVGSDTLAGIESVSLTGGQSTNTFTVNGWAGLATLAGATGNDRYVFTGSGSVRIDEAADADSDTLDFSAIASAAVSLDLAATTAQTPVAGLALTLSSATGIENVVGTALADTLVGNARDNVLTGLAGNDAFTGLAGNDTFDGGAGSDMVRESSDLDFTLSAAALAGVGSDTLAGIESVSLTGAAGDNTFTVDGWTGTVTLTGATGNDRYRFSGTGAASVTIVEGANADSDTLDFTSLTNGGVSLDLAVTTAQTPVSGLKLTLSSATGIENVVGTAFADNVLGNARANTISGLGGADTLAGRGGDDTFTGGDGNDRFDGGIGIDTVTESADLDFTLAAATLSGLGSDALGGIEQVSLTGGRNANTFTIDGWTAAASLVGSSGNDRYVFTGTPAANVTIVESAGIDTDTLDFSGLLGGGVSVDLSSTTSQAVVTGLTLTLSSASGLENVVGTASADTLLGNTRDNTLSGLAGDDTLSGGLGDDTLAGGAGTDTARESADVDFALTAAALAGVGSDTLDGIEGASLTGGGSANTFTVNGWTGSLSLSGLAGNDTYQFAGTVAVNATIVEAADADADTLDVATLANGGVSLDLSVTTSQTLVPGLSVTLSGPTGIENVTGTALADTLRGNTRSNAFFGLGGDDTFTGLAGDDVFDGGDGSDAVFESADVDFTLSAAALAGTGSDVLSSIEHVALAGGTGANTLAVDGWTGSAGLAGGTGSDRYVFRGTESASVTITEGASADSDSLDFSGLTNGGVIVDLAVTTPQTIVSGLVVTLSSATGIENVVGTAWADTLLGNTRGNTITGLSGDDTLTGRLGDDTFDGGTGSDLVLEEADVDFTLAAASLAGVGSDTLANVEQVSLTAGGAANAFIVDGWAGGATLAGAAGGDSYAFVGTTASRVTVVEAPDADSDTFDFSGLDNGAVTVDLGLSTEQTIVPGLVLTLSSASGLENVVGTTFADMLLGNTRDNALRGLGGDDTLSGRAGDDSLTGGEGTDTVTESADVDFLLAVTTLSGVGSDSLDGIEVASLTGGVGANTFLVQSWTGTLLLAGGAGGDSYEFTGTQSAAVTVVEAADADTDTLDFTSLANGGLTLDLSVISSQTVVTGLSVTLSNASGIENVTGTGFADVLRGNARANALSGLTGDDTLAGRDGDDAFSGGDGTDTVTETADVDFTVTAATLAGVGSDTLAGIEVVNLTAGEGANRFSLIGWSGIANLDGGTGSDTYVFAGTLSASVTIAEVADADSDALDFSPLFKGGVTVDLSSTNLQTVAAGLTLTLANATGLENVTGTTLADTLSGNARNNRLTGLAGNDAFSGGDGTDTVVESADVDFALSAGALAGVGSDTLAAIEVVSLSAGSAANRFTLIDWAGGAILDGGVGDDSYVFTGTLSSAVTIVEAADADTDALDFSALAHGAVTLDLAVTTPQTIVSGVTLTLSTATGIEDVTGTPGADTLSGNARNNRLSGLAGDDTLFGRAGDDTFTAASGDDSIDGGSGTDMVIESGNADFTLSAAALAGVGSDTLAGIEGVELTAGAGANTLTVDSWVGSVLLTGGTGSDTYVVLGTVSASVTILEAADADTDALDFSGLLNGGVTLDLAVTTPQTAVTGLIVTLSNTAGIENVTGTAFADALRGNARANAFAGLAGDDTFAGLAGSDAFVGGDGTDTVAESADVDFALTSATLTGLGSDTLAGVEGVILTAGAGANTFTVHGWTGSAILTGGGGNDTYAFTGTESASVAIIEAADTDTDALDFTSLFNGGVTLDLALTTAQTLVSGLVLALSSATGIENVAGTAFADTLLGNARDNVLSGLAGDDTLVGRAGDDTFTAASGDDSIDGGVGNDTVIESADVDFTLAATTLAGVGSDTLAAIETVELTGGAGANRFTIDGWSGGVILSGAAGSDRYVFSGALSAVVTIVEAADADSDMLDLASLANGAVTLDLASTTVQTLVSGLTLTLSGATGLENVVGTPGADTIHGNARGNVFSAITGDDTLIGRAGSDRYVFSGALSASVSVVEVADADADALDFAGLTNGGLSIDLGDTTPQTIAAGLVLTLSTATGLEHLTGTEAADTLVGNARDNVLSGLGGDDTLAGDEGTDTVVEAADVDFTLTPSTLTGVGLDGLTGIESAHLTGGASANVFTLDAWSGSATLAGGAGGDRYLFVGAVSAVIGIVEGADADTDALDFSGLTLADGTGVSVDLALTTPQAVTAALTLSLSDATGLEDVTGTAAADTMLGNARDNVITGLAGDDTLSGRAGSNVLDGGSGTDTVTETGNVDVTLTAATISGVGADALVGIEVVSLEGGSGANRFTVHGWGGSVILAGRGGDDSYVFVGGTSTRATVVEADGADSDTLDFSAVTLAGVAGLTVDLADTTVQEVTTGLFITLSSTDGIENVSGSDADDTMRGNARDNVFRGIGGQDTIDGRAGTDTFVKAFGLVNVLVTGSSLTGCGTDAFANIEVVNVTLGPDPSECGSIGIEGRILDASSFTGTLIADFGTDSLEITTSATPSGLATNTLVIPAILESLEIRSGTIYLASEIITGTGGSVTLHSSGAIIDDNDPGADGVEPANNVVASRLVLSAIGGVGSDDVLDTQVSFLSVTNSGSGDVSILNQKNVHGPVDVIMAVNTAGGVKVENFGDETNGITVSGTVRASGAVALISHSPLTIEGSIQSTGDSEITLEADTLKMTNTSKIVTTGDVAMNSRVVSLTDADMTDAKIKNSRNDAQIDVTGGAFNTLTSTGKGTQIDVRGGAFKTLTASSAGAIDVRGGKFEILSTTNVGKIDISGGSFTVLNASGAGKIDVSGGSFKTLSASGAGQIDVAGGDFEELTSSGSGPLGITDGTFKTVTMSGAGAIDVRGGKFQILATSGGGKIDVSGGSFKTLSTSGTGQIDVAGGDFDELTSTGSGVLGISDGTFKTVTVSGTGGIDLRGGKFEVLTSSGAGQIDVSGGKFSVGLGSSGAAKIDVTGGEFEQLVASGTGALGITDGTFKTVTVSGAGAIDVRGGKFQVLTSSGAGQIDVSGGKFSVGLGSSGAAKIDVTGGEFEQLVASGTGALGITDGTFKTVTVSGTGAIDLRGGKFEVVTSSGAGQIDVSGGKFSVGLGSSGAAKIDVAGGDFDQLVATGSGALGITDGSFKTVTVTGTGAIDVRGGKFEVLTSSGAGKIDIHGGKFSVGLGSSGAAKIDVAGGDFDLLLASGDGALGITDGSFKTVTVSGAGAIDVRGGKFNVVTSSGAGKIDIAGGTFNIVNASGAGKIDVAGGTFNTLNASNSSGIDIRGGSFKVGVNSTGSGNKIDVTGATLASLANTGAGAIINVSGASFESITNHGDNVTVTVVGDGGSNTLINSGNDVAISFAAGAGADVFVNDGRGDGIHGNRVALTIDLGAGRDRAVLGGTSLVGTVAGGDGDDTILLVRDVSGELTLGEAADLDRDTLDFSPIEVVAGAGVTVDLALTTVQVVKPGLSLTLSSATGFEDVVGSSGADILRGNARDNALFGSDLPDDRLGAAATSNGRHQVAYLDFDTETDEADGDHVYTTAERASIASRLNAIYSAFQVTFVLDVPSSGEYATIVFNKPRPSSEDSGGWASEIDFGNWNYGGIATVDVNGLLGVSGGPEATSATFVAASAWVAAHELAHLLGMRHADSFGPPGFGIEAPPGMDGYLIDPAYVGPAAAWETNRHIIETPALTGFTLWDLVAVEFFGEREAIKLVYNDTAPLTPDGNLFVAEQADPHATRTPSGSQELVPMGISIPNTLLHGLNSGKDLMAGVVNVKGQLTASGERDVYRIAGRRGDLLNIQVMSAALERYKDSSSSLVLDAVLTVYDEAGNVVVSSDDEFETHDPNIIDLVLEADGTYYIEVKGFYHVDGDALDTGNYELFLSRFDAASRADVGDVLEGRGGDDTLSGGRGDDTYVFDGSALGSDRIVEDVRLEKSGIGFAGSADGRDAGDRLDFTGFASPVTLDLTSTAVQVVAAGNLSLLLSSAVDAADEPSAAIGIEQVLGSSHGNSVAGNARANDFLGGGSVNVLEGDDADDEYRLGGGSNRVDAGAGIDTVELAGSAADYAIVISGSTVTVTSQTGSVPASVSILSSVEIVRFADGGTATLLVGVGDALASAQSAVDLAADGDTILVASGVFSGAVDIDKDDLTLVSYAGSAATVLVASGGATVTVSGTGVTVRGFTIDNAGVDGGSAILIAAAAEVTIDGNVIRNAASGVTRAADGLSATASITGNTFASTVQAGVAGTAGLALTAFTGNTFATSVEAINLGAGVSLAGNALDRAGIFVLIDAQTLALSAGAAVVDSRSSTTYVVASQSVAEHQRSVATVPTTGLTGSATFSVVAGVDAGLFQLDAASGVLQFASVPRFTAPADVGADNVSEVIVRATDGVRGLVTRYTVTVVDVNVAPEFAEATRVIDIGENAIVAGVEVATDWDVDALAYSIVIDPTDNADGALFSIDPTTGTLSFRTAPDFENLSDANGDGVYQVRVAATDPGGLVTHQVVSVVVSDANDNAPVFTGAATASFVENTAIGTVLYTATRTDADVTAAYRNVSYAIKAGVGDGAKVAINAANGEVSLLATADYETTTSYRFVIVADDGVNRTERIVTFGVVDANDNAPVITSAATGTVTENAATTAVIYVATRTDADVTAANRQVIWTIKPSVGDAAAVAIDAATGVVTLRASADFETKASYVFTVVASDGVNTAERSVTVNVVDTNDNAPVITSGATGSVTENAATTTVVYTGSRTDADASAAFRQVTWSIKPLVGDAARMAINAATGAVTLLVSANFEAKTSYVFTVVASDGVNTAERSVTVSVVDTNDVAPVITSPTTGTVVENAPTSTVIYTATRTDADATAAFQLVTWSIKPAVGDAARVAINATTGAVTLLATADSETKTSYLFTVVASDGVNRTEKAVTVAVTDLNDNAPVITSSAVGTVTENAATTTVIYTGTRTDADVTAGFRLVTWSIKPAVADAARVAINASTGAVTLLAAADFETKTSYLFTVVASDGVNRSEKPVTVSVVNVDDTAATFTSATTATVVASATLNPVVYTAVVNDTADVSQGVTFSLATADATLFAIDATTGVVTVKGSTTAMKGKTYSFTVSATDKGGAKKVATRLVTLTVT